MPFAPNRRILLGLVLGAALLSATANPLQADDRFIILQSTTSTQNSGLFDHILPIFTKRTGIEVRVVAVGTGQALKNAANGDGDVVLVHSKPDEEKFVADGFGVKRVEVMYNDFVLVGPESDPAKVAGGKDAVEAFRKVKSAQAPFVSRGDKSGTHFAELEIWRAAGIDIAKDRGPWYRETGQGMGPALNTAAGMAAYVLADRGTWLSFRNRAGLTIVLEGDARLFNQYGIILVSPRRHPAVKKDMGQAFIDWIVSAEGQAAIAAFKIGGGQLFFPNFKGG